MYHKRGNFSASSYDNQSNLSTQQDLTYRMIKDVHHLKSKSLSRNRNPHSTIHADSDKYENFHILTLRESIHNNKKYEKLFSTISNEKKSKNFPNYSKILNERLHFSSSSLLSNESKQNHCHTLSSYKTKAISRNYKNTIADTMKKFNLLTCNTRVESLTSFRDKTKKISKEKYIYSIKQKNIKKIEENNENNLDIQKIDYNHFLNAQSLFSTFENTSTLYQKYLIKQKEKETDINEKLKEKKIQIINEIQRIKKKLSKLKSVMEQNYKNKFFLMCVKNNTTDVNKFAVQDRLEYQKNMEIIKNINKINVLSLASSAKKNKIASKRFSQILESDVILFNQLERKRINGPYMIFKNVDEFREHLNNISLSIAKLLIKFNQSQNEVATLRKNLEENKKNLESEQQMDNFFSKEIEMCEEKLKNLKAKNKDLNEYYNSIPKNEKINVFLKNKIFEIYTNLNSRFILNKKKKNSYNINEITYLRDIETGFFKLMTLINFYKENSKKQYQEICERIDKINKIKLIQSLKLKESEKMTLKIEKIIKKQNKLILQSHRQIDILNHAIPKKEKKKAITLTENDINRLLDQQLKYCFSEK